MPKEDNDTTSVHFDEHLDAAYRRAVYRVAGFELRIGLPHPAFDDWLEEGGYRAYALLTAYNPRSRELPPAINAARQETLRQTLLARGTATAPASGHDPEAAWPPEPGFCLLDPSRGEAAALGTIYAQNAIVEGERGKAPKLTWL